MILSLTLNYSAFYSTVNIAEFEQRNVCSAWEKVVSDNKFVFSNCEKYIVLWAGMGWQNLLGYMFSSNPG